MDRWVPIANYTIGKWSLHNQPSARARIHEIDVKPAPFEAINNKIIVFHTLPVVVMLAFVRICK